MKVEPAGPGHRAAVHHGYHSGENRGGLTSHKPHHHPDHESAEDSARYKSIPTQFRLYFQTAKCSLNYVYHICMMGLSRVSISQMVLRNAVLSRRGEKKRKRVR